MLYRLLIIHWCLRRRLEYMPGKLGARQGRGVDIRQLQSHVSPQPQLAIFLRPTV